MKYTVLLLAAAVIGLLSCTTETVSNNMDNMPKAVQTAVKDNFYSDVIKTKSEVHSIGTDEYEITLADGTQIKYEDQQWEEVKMPIGQSVPAAYVPENISNYVTKNCPGQTIYKIERESNGYQVNLCSGTTKGLKLDFDLNGNFVKYDD